MRTAHAQQIRASSNRTSTSAAGDRRALDFEKVIRLHGEMLRRRAKFLTGSHQDASDLFQNTIERALRAEHPPGPGEPVERWLLTIMYNAFLDDRRSKVVRARCLRRLAICSAGTCDEALPLWRLVDDDELEASVARLPTKLREMMSLRRQGASYDELSRHFRVPLSTVGTILHRIRRRIRSWLEQGGLEAMRRD